MLRRLFAVSVSTAGVLFSLPSAGLSFTNLYVFGDSLVDSGNTHDLALAFGQPDPTPAAAGYYDGRFSNGPTFADVVNVAIEGTYIDNRTDGGENYGYGGARARNNGDSLPDLQAQVSQFNSTVGGVADPGALFLLDGGGNDAFDILSGANRSATISAVATAVSQSVLTLQGLGAQNILFVGVPIAGGDRQLAVDMNNAILAALPSGVLFFDSIGFIDAVVANPAAYGLPSDIIFGTRCLGSGFADPEGPPTCNHFALFDNIHPTTQFHQAWGDQLIAALVPEPGTGSLVALGLVCFAARRRVA